MIYLLIVVGTSFVLQSFYFGKMLMSVKRRCKAMDTKLNSFNQWVITANQSTTQRLDKINEVLYLLYTNNQPNANSYDDVLESLMEQLRQLKKHADKGHAISENLLRPVSGFANTKTVI